MARGSLERLGLLEGVRRGVYRTTDKGREVMKNRGRLTPGGDSEAQDSAVGGH